MKSRFLLILACLISLKVVAQNGPQPGDIYREYAVNLRSGDNWRVTDPKATNPGAAAFLPNPTLSISIDDMDQAVRAEVLMDIWGGHPGTSGKKFRFNANDWMDIPHVPTLESRPKCYMTEYNVILDLPLEYLQEGANTFDGTSGGQICNNFNWGQWGWYVMMVRVYYHPDKAHTIGQIIQPASGDTIRDDSDINVAPADSGSVSLIQILGHYYGYDENGDGIYKDWHRAYHGKDITGHIGTIEASPFQQRWNTRYVPDQEARAVSLMARIKDTSGIWFVSDIVDSISLQRPDSLKVHMYTPVGVTQDFWVRAGNTKQCYIHIDTLDQGMEARLYHRTWNAGDDEAAGGSIDKPLLVNEHSYKCYGNNHFFALSSVPLAFGDLKSGLNDIAYTSDTQHHGIEVLWPGPAIVIRFVVGGETVANPIFSPPDGHTFQGILNPSILSETEGSRVYYTTDGTDPNPGDARYRGQLIRVDRDMTFKARAFKQNYYESGVATAHYSKDITSVISNRSENISFYPNPATNRLYLDLPPMYINGNFTIVNSEGKVVRSGYSTGNLIDISKLGNGLYILKYNTLGQYFTGRFIIRR